MRDGAKQFFEAQAPKAERDAHKHVTEGRALSNLGVIGSVLGSSRFDERNRLGS
ncbi:hypothetical protein D9M72_605330 [compost metagenome]